MKLLEKYEKFYFTFGNGESMPLEGGWVLILARYADEALKIFRQCFPDKTPGVPNCATFYFEEDFHGTNMYLCSDNQGAGLHMILMPDDTYLDAADRERFDCDENVLLQSCMHCGNLMVKDNLHWINDLHGIPFKKVCEECDSKVMEEVNNMADYTGYECIDEY